MQTLFAALIPPDSLKKIGVGLVDHAPMTVVALFLVWWITGGLSRQLEQNTAALTMHTREAAIDARVTLYFLKQICLHGAATDRELRACDAPPELTRPR
jgi:hypothetical protein